MCNKIQFDTAKTAKKYIKQNNGRAHYKNGKTLYGYKSRKPLNARQVYYCTECLCYHMTSQTKKQSRRYK